MRNNRGSRGEKICSFKQIFSGEPSKEDECSEVLEGLYIGNKNVARDREKLLSLGITHVVNCTVERHEGGCHNYFENEPGFHYLRCAVQDSDAARLRDYFEDVTKFVDQARESGHGVLIHCQQGAYVFLKTKRSIVKPKKNFLRELKVYEKELKQPKKANRDSKDSKKSTETKEHSNAHNHTNSSKRPLQDAKESVNSTKRARKVSPTPPTKKGPSMPPGVRLRKVGPSMPPGAGTSTSKPRKLGPTLPPGVGSKP
ncbi:hypothetical protein AAMO2058_000390400 [Amorphochlora amoebiformis]